MKLKKSTLIASALMCCAAAIHGEELLVSIQSPGVMAQGAGLVLAGQALEQKHDVRILLCDAAGDMAAHGHVSAA